jgi:lipopolysaccharide biosynthesis protein
MTLDNTRKLAIVVHAFYPDVFADIIARLDRLKIGFDLFLSFPPGGGEKIRFLTAKKNYRVVAYECENKGRDIAPFLQMLPEIASEKFDYVLKLHTKKSFHYRDGTNWRVRLYDYLLDGGQLRSNIDFMENSRHIGILSDPQYIVPMRTNWPPNQKKVRNLARRMGLDRIGIDDDAFVAGSMFLARMAALEPLLKISISPSEFEVEEDQKDGTMAHAMERAFTYSAYASGFELAGAKDADMVARNYKKFGGKIWKLKLRKWLSRIIPR